VLEIAVNHLAAAIAAQDAGADRIELCDNLREGGTTPSYGYLLKARELLHIPIYPIIRPRGGNFVYSEDEFDCMKKDVLLCKKTGIDGVVIGFLHETGVVDKERTTIITELAWPMGVTFHRAFDRTIEPFAALETIIECGCERVLTSGQVPAAPDGVTLIKKLIEAAWERINIMPGSGVRSANLQQLIKDTGASEYHSSAKKTIRGEGIYAHPGFATSDGEYDTVDADEIRLMKGILEKAFHPEKE
jgi:copper homeostasis protein